ncbi:hypothetical protein V9K92_10625 [Phyllobacterium sp. CCNWLW109]|uniref:hypothetical protein n=1 Tax=Phyllobacterium sp. CCNWLW109 TaxID=3127479 RepID=UPI00307852D0
MGDFNIIDVPAMLNTRVTNYDKDGNEVPYDGEWHRSVAETMYVFAEFLSQNALLTTSRQIARNPRAV